MKPSDFFLSRRQILGFLVPGVLWLTTGLWLFGLDPVCLLAALEAKTRILVVFITASYIIGYALQSATFAIRDTSKRWATANPSRAEAQAMQNLKKAVRQAVLSKPQLAELNEHQLAQFCKWYAAKDSPYFQSVFTDLEDIEVNFTIGMSFPLMFLAAVGAVRTFVFPPGSGAPYKHWYGITLLLLFLMGCYMHWRSSYVRQAEEEAWYRAFLLAWSEAEKSSGPAEKQDAGNRK